VFWVVKRGDVTKEAVDAVINAANERLAGGGGVDGAIQRAAGPDLARALSRYSGCPTGEAVVTPGFRLPARFVVHAVGPRWRGGGQHESALLRAAYLNALRRAIDVGARTVAFPAISTGAYGYPLEEALSVAAEALADGARLPKAPEEVRLMAFTSEVEQAWTAALGARCGQWPA